VLIYINSLESSMDSEACMHWSPDLWKQCCAFFHHQSILVAPEYIVVIRHPKSKWGFGRRLLPAQAYSIWHCLCQLHSPVVSTLIGHTMGIGKSTIALGIIYVQHIMNMLWDDIFKDPLKHCAKDNNEECCPINKEVFALWGFDCPCAAGSPTHFCKQRFGIAAILIPKSILSVWESESRACYKPPVEDGVLVSNAPSIMTTVFAYNQADLKPYHSLLFGQARPQWKRMATDKSGNQREVYTTDPKRGASGTQTTNRYIPRLVNSSIVVITTSHSWQSNFLDKTREVINKNVGSSRNPHMQMTDQSQKSIVSLFFRDECHIERNERSESIKMFRLTIDRQQHWDFACFPMSGTPLTAGPGDIEWWIKVMCRDSWRSGTDKTLRKWSDYQYLEKITKSWNTAVKKQDEGARATMKDIIRDMQPLVEKICIRFTTDSRLNGQRPMKIPACEYKEVKCDNGVNWNDKIRSTQFNEIEHFKDQKREHYIAYQAKREKARDKSKFPEYVPLKNDNKLLYWRSRVYASFPALMDLKDENGRPYRLTKKEFEAHVKGSDTEGNPVTQWNLEEDDPFFLNKEAIFASSGKLQEMEKIMKKFKNFKDGEGKLARIIWSSYFHVGSYIIYLVCSDDLYCHLN
jgi:hypothetical protein